MNRSHRARRRERREERRRELSRRSLATVPKTPEDVFSFGNLYKAARVCAKGTLWKSAAMKFDRYRAVNCIRLRESLLSGKYRRQPPVRFTLCERGKIRHIVGPRYKDRVVQRCLCDRFIVPMVSRSLVYTNSASLKGKGTSFARSRFERDMLLASQRYGAAARVFQYDVKNYFGSIPSAWAHAVLSDIILKPYQGRPESDSMSRLLDIAALYSRESYFLTLGNQVNQLAAIAYLNRLDHAFHELLGQGGAGRYMDDGYIFCSEKDLPYIRHLFLAGLESLGLQPNVKACFSSRLNRELTFLKIRFSWLMAIRAAISPRPHSSDIEGTSSPSVRLWIRKNCRLKSSTHLSRASRVSCPSPPQGTDALSNRKPCRRFGHLRTFPDNVLKQPKNVRKRPHMSAIAYHPPITQEIYNGAPLTMLLS